MIESMSGRSRHGLTQLPVAVYPPARPASGHRAGTPHLGGRMPHRLLVTGAGSGESNNLIRSLSAAGEAFVTVGCHPDPFTLKKSLAARNYVVPPLGHPEYADRLRAVVEKEAVDLLIPTSDADTRRISALRDELPCRTFLPRREVIDLCQDKYRLTTGLRRLGIAAPRTYAVTGLSEVPRLFRRFKSHRRLWCRPRTGTGSMGAVPVETPQQARGWIAYWEQMRGVPATAFTIAEYLPGRDFACQSLWKEGRLVLIKACERLSYFGGWNRASGVSSTPDLAKTVREPRVLDVCVRAIRAIDPAASGVYAVDLKEDAGGRPCITEINIGRFFMITNLFDFTGRHNMAVAYTRLALGEDPGIADPDDSTDDYYLVRDIDCPPAIFHADELADGIEGGL